MAKNPAENPTKILPKSCRKHHVARPHVAYVLQYFLATDLQ